MIELQGKYANAKFFATTIEEGVYQQVYGIINSPAFKGQKVVCMPDVHVGASGPCGLVATIGDYVCPEHIGVDIGCSVSMMVLDKKVPNDKYAELEQNIKDNIPFGVNLQKEIVIDKDDFFRFLKDGFKEYRGFWPEMLSGLPEEVNEAWLFEQLDRLSMDKDMFYKSLGTVGSGNHFVEYDEQEDGDMAGITLHFGSRHFGVRVCKYWMERTKNPLTKDDIKNLTCSYKEQYLKEHADMSGFGKDLFVYIESVKNSHLSNYLDGKNLMGYLEDMCLAQLYAQYNHKTVQRIIGGLIQKYGIKIDRIITSTHNFIDLQDHTLRKSAIRSYAGEEMLVPFNMRDGVAICEGLSNAEWLNACAHGAGRKLSRSKAKEIVSMDEFKESMKNVYSTTVCEDTLDESPMAYKDTAEISGLIRDTCKIKFMMVPRINIKATNFGS